LKGVKGDLSHGSYISWIISTLNSHNLLNGCQVADDELIVLDKS
jgi:hypothetical protein